MNVHELSSHLSHGSRGLGQLLNLGKIQFCLSDCQPCHTCHQKPF